DEVHEDFSGVYRDVTFGQEYTVLEELKHFSLRNTVDERYFYVTVGSSATLGSGLQKFLLQSAEVKFNTGWKKVKMQFVLSANWGVGPANYGRVTFYDQARRVLATCQTRALVDLTPDTVEYTAPEGSFIGYAIFGCANSGNAIRVTDMRMSK
ncbi:hypothetical protein N5D61_26420, partial [Pseudomonas sp. GD03842]|uniref:hypothetical protein n=1 Tax=Pseudomonas sp. GD03842 TaxID=2975385 RepID=UPI00244A5E98